jgi:branched-chain amino acid transport system substrate-binding protein
VRFNGIDHSESTKRRPRWHWIGIVLAFVAIFGAACSSSKEGGPDSSGTTANMPAGSPVNIGEIASLTGTTTFPGGFDGVKAAIAATNKAGGINGHALKLIVCDDQGNPNVAVECANRMVSSNVIYVDASSDQGNSYMPVLRSAGIPVTTGTGQGSDVLNFPNSYILGSGSTSVGGAAAMCAKLGSTRIGIAQYDVAGLDPLVNLIYKTLVPFGLSKANTSITLIPPTAVDLSTYAASLIQKSTCIAEVLPPQSAVSLTASIHSQNPSIPVAGNGAATVAQWHAIGKLSDNVCDNASLPPAGLTEAPGMGRYNAEMDTYNEPGLRDTRSISGWASVHLAAKLLASVSNPTAAKYMHALNTAGTINLPPLPPLNFSRPANLIPGITRVMSEDVVYFRHINGGAEAPFYGGRYVNVLSLKSQPPIPAAAHC